jgi:hypothetical protein
MTMNTVEWIREIISRPEIAWKVEEYSALTDVIQQLKWVPVSGGLPKYTNDYNVVCVIGSMLGCFETVRTYRFEAIRGQQPCWIVPDKYDEIVKITHWRRLPQPPAKDGE